MADLWHARAQSVTVIEREQQRLATLRLRHPSAQDIARIGAMLGTPLPLLPNHAEGEDVRAIWIGPDEWLIAGEIAPGEAIEAAARDAAAASCVNVGDGRCIFDVEGREAADLLAKGTSLDLHPAAFAPGRSAMTLFAKIPVIIDRPARSAGFRLYFDVSFRAYVRCWFGDALVEFG
jgi:sarcosine oxidase subunit gamma